MTIVSLDVSLKNAPDKDVVFICKQQIKGEAIDCVLVFGLVRLPEALSHSIATELWEGGKRDSNSEICSYTGNRNPLKLLYLQQMWSQLATQTPTTFKRLTYLKIVHLKLNKLCSFCLELLFVR